MSNSEHWVTINGVHVLVDDSTGSISRGPKNLIGKQVREAKKVNKEINSKKNNKTKEKYNELEDSLGEPFDPMLMPNIKKDWKAFYKEPKKYKDTLASKMVNQYIDEKPFRTPDSYKTTNKSKKGKERIGNIYRTNKTEDAFKTYDTFSYPKSSGDIDKSIKDYNSKIDSKVKSGKMSKSKGDSNKKAFNALVNSYGFGIFK